MKLKALKYMRYASKKVQAGEVFEANAADVRVLLAVKHAVVYVEPVVPRKKVVVPVMTAALEAEFVPGFSMSESVPTAVSAEPAPKRTYKRRDMVAE